MATVRWIGNALPVQQVTTITIAGTWATGDIATVTMNGKDISITIGTDATTTAVALALQEAISGTDQTGTGDHTFSVTNGQTIPEFREVTATVASAVLTLTADTLVGKPFTVTTSETTASTDGVVGTPSTTTAATGPHHFDNADNWSTGSVPVDADDIWFDSGSVSCLYALSQSSVTPSSINVTMGFTGSIGLPETNTDTSGYSYREYRDTYLALGESGDATNISVNIGNGPGQGSGRIKIANGTSQATVNVRSTGQASETGVPAFLWKGTAATNVFNITKGDAGIGFFADDAATVATLRVGYQTNQLGDSSVACGEGVTLTTVNVTGGELITRSAVTTANVNGGELTHAEGTLGTLNLDGGQCIYRSDGTMTTANVGSGGVLDFRQDMRARTVTNCNLYDGSSYYDPNGTVTHTNGIDLVRCEAGDLANFRHAPHVTISFSSI
jgi:hypothetical protein